ncbi:transient receptor potential cation channel protein painless-like [Drosophila takahashii]|uniref:transient receptor potential cation channel protein painless-like n=1 Tax=Drosophila takahashii TaxID=29030 RepID=UPI003898FEB9
MDTVVVYIDPQAQLEAALANKDIRQFLAALIRGARADLQGGRGMNIYEKALSTPGCQEFIKACITHGCQVNYVSSAPRCNEKLLKPAISYAADSMDSGNLAALLLERSGDTVQVDRKYAHVTPLNSLASQLTEDNAFEVLNCMRILLKYGASTNSVDQNGFTPLHHILRSKVKTARLELVKLFLDHPDIEIDHYHGGCVRRLLQAEFPELPLPRRIETFFVFGELHTIKVKRDEAWFVQLIAQHGSFKDMEEEQKREYMELLQYCILRDWQEAFKAMLATDAKWDINCTLYCPKKNTLVEWAVRCGNWRALEHLLKWPNLRLDGLGILNKSIDTLELKPIRDFDYHRCFSLLLNSEFANVNETTPDYSAPLAYAMKVRNTVAMQKLLEYGAYIGSQRAAERPPIEDMPPEVLEDHFDSSIKANKKNRGDKDFEIIIRNHSLIPIDALVHDEMSPIIFMAQSEELRHLLQHPLISIFLYLKWRRIREVFYLNLVLYSLFTICIITYTLLKLYGSENILSLTITLRVCSCVGTGCLILREAVQFMIAPARYLKSLTNVLEWIIIVLSILTCIELGFIEKTHRILAAFTIFLVSIEFCLLVGSLPVLAISTHILMLREVCISFVKSFSLYSIFVMTFSLCFFILFGKEKDKDESIPFDFSKPFVALIKTIVMMTGELNSGDLDFTSIFTYLFFLLFVMFITIVLLNLLNGLAVNDTQNIKQQAELNGVICRAYLVSRYEGLLKGGGREEPIFKGTKVMRIICQWLHLYPKYVSPRHVVIRPNDNNQVLTFGRNIHEKRALEPQPWCFSFFNKNSSRIPSEMVKMAMKAMETAEQRQKLKKIEERREKLIEDKLTNMAKMLKELQERK